MTAWGELIISGTFEEFEEHIAESPVIENNIFRSVENINLKTIIAYKENGIKHSFPDDYND